MKKSERIKEWVEKAEGDYETIVDLRKKRKKRQRYIIAFHCQQCIEKYLKALLTFYEIKFPKQHDLVALLDLLLIKDSLLLPIRKQLKELTPYAVEFRYPGDEVTTLEVTEMVGYARQIRKILRKRLGAKS